MNDFLGIYTNMHFPKPYVHYRVLFNKTLYVKSAVTVTLASQMCHEELKR